MILLEFAPISLSTIASELFFLHKCIYRWYMVLLEFVPIVLSTIASIAAAIAAFISLRISKRAASIAELTALAAHQNSASLEYAKAINTLNKEAQKFYNFCYSMSTNWAKDLECKDNYEMGGHNPRPLRHVLSNGSEMLAHYALSKTSRGGFASQNILYVIRHGIGNLSDGEYQKLLKKADGTYHNFQSTFGIPSKSTTIISAPAFRWVCYQLIKRVKSKDWESVWKEAWCESGWLYKYQAEYLKIKPILKAVQASLKLEKEKLAHTAFPLSHNKPLSEKYTELLHVLECLLEDCEVELLETYKDWEFNEELSQLVLCSMATAYFAAMQLSIIKRNYY